jgi:hypothetical protein
MADSGKSPAFWCVVWGVFTFIVVFGLFAIKEISSRTVVSSLSFGFFAGSMAFSIISLREAAIAVSQSPLPKISILIWSSLSIGILGGLYYFLNGNIPKGIEISSIVMGISTLAIGHFLEEKLQKH